MSLVGRLISGIVGMVCSKIIDTAGFSAIAPAMGTSPAACIALSRSVRSDGRSVLRPGIATRGAKRCFVDERADRGFVINGRLCAGDAHQREQYNDRKNALHGVPRAMVTS